MTFTISVQERDGELKRVPLKRLKTTKDDAMRLAWDFSQYWILSDVVVTRGSKHVATYRGAKLTHYNGKEHKP